MRILPVCTLVAAMKALISPLPRTAFSSKCRRSISRSGSNFSGLRCQGVKVRWIRSAHSAPGESSRFQLPCRRSSGVRWIGLATAIVPSSFQKAASAAARARSAALRPALQHDGGIHGAGAGAAHRLERQAAVLDQRIEHAPGEGAVRAAALQGEIDALGRTHAAILHGASALPSSSCNKRTARAASLWRRAGRGKSGESARRPSSGCSPSASSSRGAWSTTPSRCSSCR